MLMSIIMTSFNCGMMLIFNQPFAMVLILVIQTLPIITLSMLAVESSWIGYTTFLVYLGGLLIIFIYISALIPNQFNNLKMPWLPTSISILLLGLMLVNIKPNNSIEMLVGFTNSNYSTWIFMMINYLLFALFSINGLTNFIKTPLKMY